MARFFGAVGYDNGQTEQAAGVFEQQILERNYRGDVLRNTRRVRETQFTTNPNLTVENSISIVADAYALENFAAIRFVIWNGEAWVVDQVEVQAPRLILRLGGIYNGPRDPDATP